MIDEYLATLETALGQKSRQTDEILEEVRQGLDEQVKRLVADGMSQKRAVEQTLDDFGNPYELAHQMRREVPPFGGNALTVVRYLAAGGVMLWTLALAWMLRGWCYGLPGLGVVVGILLLHFPAIVLLWPRMVWRKNWLFGLIPSGLGLLVVIGLNLGGTQSTTSAPIMIPEANGELIANDDVATPVQPEAETRFPLTIIAAAGVVACVLLIAMQQQRQRRFVVAALLLVTVVVEAAFQIEEYVFRKDVVRLVEFRNSQLERGATLISKEVFEREGPELRGPRPGLWVNDGHFTLFWDRALSPGFAIRYSSETGLVSIQD